LTDTAEKNLRGQGSSSLWQPLRVSTFRNLLIADVVSDIGTFMQSVGAAWLMVSLGAGPIYVALTQTASSLPYFLLALPAGSAGDIFDRRKLVLATESWMMGVALLLAVLAIAGFMSPWLLLVLTFALSAGDAFETPTWRAILPELVPKDDLAAASALNGIEFNLARAVGPALAGIVIAAAGVATAFVANFVSFFGVILVVAKWKRPIRKRTAPPETLSGATVAAIRYVRHSPAILTVVVRTGVVMFFSSALFALLPTIARSVNRTAIGYGILLGCFGAGAIGGALIMQAARARWSTEVIVSAGVLIFGVGDRDDRWITQIEHACAGNAGGRRRLGDFYFPDQRSGAEPCARLGTSASACNLYSGLSGELRSGKRSLGRGSPTSRHPSRSCLCRRWNRRKSHVRALRKTS
jgi:MFS family permease